MMIIFTELDEILDRVITDGNGHVLVHGLAPGSLYFQAIIHRTNFEVV
jgi:hypothetical protein